MLLNTEELTADKIMDWLTQLEAIGAAISDLAFHESEVLTHHGQGIGNAISEYARSINFVINGCYHPLTRFLEGGGLTPIGALKDELECLSKKKIGPDDIYRINKGLAETEKAISDSMPLHDIRKELLRLRTVAKGNAKDSNRQGGEEAFVSDAMRGADEKEMIDIIDKGEVMADQRVAAVHH